MDRDDNDFKESDYVTLSAEPETHWDRYKWYYITGGALIAGILIGSFLTRGSVLVRTNHGIVANTVNLNQTIHNYGGYACKIVENLETGQIFRTVKEAAEHAGVSAAKMSKHLNGHSEAVNDMHYAIIGLSTT